MARVILDASALLAYLKDEPGAEAVEAGLAAGGLISAVNLAETLSKLADAGLGALTAEELLELNGVGTDAIVIADFTTQDARAVGQLRPSTRKQGLSLGERACLALAMRTGLAILTADRLWLRLGLRLDIQLIR